MSKRALGLCSFVIAVSALCSPQSTPPTTYTVVVVNSMLGPAVTQHIYRDGARAVIDNESGDTKVRTIYDLNAHKNVSWNLKKPSEGCGEGSYTGDWGDPFNGDLMAELAKEHPKQTGTETVNGFTTNVLETDGTGPSKAKAKVWVDQKYGFLVKAQLTEGAQTSTIVEVKSATFGPPASGMFKIPAFCAKSAASAAPSGPSENDRYAAETGGQPSDFVNANAGPGSKEACSVSFRIVQAGSMAPITSGVEILVDRKADLDHPSPCKDTIGKNNYHTYTGAGCSLQDVTPQFKNGVVRLDAVPERMNISVIFLGDGSQSGALVYRQCFAPVTPLLMVVKNPQRVTDGVDWLFVKSGKFAGVGGAK